MDERINLSGLKVYILIRNGVRYRVRVKETSDNPNVVGGVEALVESVGNSLSFYGWVVGAELEAE